MVAEQIVANLRQIGMLKSQGKSVAAAGKEDGLIQQNYYLYRMEFGGLNVEHCRKLKQLEQENGRLNKLFSNSYPEKKVMNDTAEGMLQAPIDNQRLYVPPSIDISAPPSSRPLKRNPPP